MTKLLFLHFILLPFILYSQNVAGTYYSINDKCKIIITLSNNSYNLNLGTKLIKKGKYKLTQENRVTYLDFDEISSMYSNDTIYIQNSGNSNNEYLHFKECDEKFIYLIKKYNRVSKKVKGKCIRKKNKYLN